LIASVTYRRDSQYAMATAYGTALMIGLTVDDVNAWPQRIRQVNGQGVVAAARGLLKRDAVTSYLVPQAAPPQTASAGAPK
jgi:zinc protease